MKAIWIILIWLSVVRAENLSDEQSLNRLIESAKNGNEESLRQVLNILFFEANSLKTADPQKALDLYIMAKKANPNLHLYVDEDKDEKFVKTIEMCSESKGFDGEAFIKKYHLNSLSSDKVYGVWELAEEASHEGKFGKANPKLVFDLVCRGGEIFEEMETAVQDTYLNWKNKKSEHFDICEYIISGMGMDYCDSRIESKKLDDINHKLRSNDKKVFDDAYKKAKDFYELKSSIEEGYGGTLYAAKVVVSQREQKNKFLDLLKNIQIGYKPIELKEFSENDRFLNKVYKDVMKILSEKEERDDEMWDISNDDVKAVQRLWIPYRDSSAKLFSILNPSVSENEWKSYLTRTRIEELKSLR